MTLSVKTWVITIMQYNTMMRDNYNDDVKVEESRDSKTGSQKTDRVCRHFSGRRREDYKKKTNKTLRIHQTINRCKHLDRDEAQTSRVRNLYTKKCTHPGVCKCVFDERFTNQFLNLKAQGSKFHSVGLSDDLSDIAAISFRITLKSIDDAKNYLIDKFFSTHSTFCQENASLIADTFLTAYMLCNEIDEQKRVLLLTSLYLKFDLRKNIPKLMTYFTNTIDGEIARFYREGAHSFQRVGLDDVVSNLASGMDILDQIPESIRSLFCRVFKIALNVFLLGKYQVKETFIKYYDVYTASWDKFTIFDFTKLVSDFMRFAVSLANTALKKQPLSWVFFDLKDKDKVMADILFDEMNIYTQDFKKFNSEYDYKMKITQLICEYSKIRNPNMAITSRLMKLHSILNSYDGMVSSVKRHRAAFAVVIHGKPGVGKSTIAMTIMAELADVLGYTWRGDPSVSVMNFASQYDDTYRNNPCMLAEDMASLKSTNPQAAGSLAKILNIANTVPVPAVCADLERKGNVHYRVKCFIGTTNTVDLDATANMLNPQAVYRRFVFVEAVPKPEFSERSGVFNKVKIAEFRKQFSTLCPDQNYEYFTCLYNVKEHIYREDRDQINLKEYDGAQIGMPGSNFTGLTYQELIVALRAIAKFKAEAQDSELSRVDDFEQCGHCHLLRRTCGCGIRAHYKTIIDNISNSVNATSISRTGEDDDSSESTFTEDESKGDLSGSQLDLSLPSSRSSFNVNEEVSFEREVVRAKLQDMVGQVVKRNDPYSTLIDYFTHKYPQLDVVLIMRYVEDLQKKMVKSTLSNNYKAIVYIGTEVIDSRIKSSTSLGKTLERVRRQTGFSVPTPFIRLRPTTSEEEDYSDRSDEEASEIGSETSSLTNPSFGELPDSEWYQFYGDEQTSKVLDEFEVAQSMRAVATQDDSMRENTYLETFMDKVIHVFVPIVTYNIRMVHFLGSYLRLQQQNREIHNLQNLDVDDDNDFVNRPGYFIMERVKLSQLLPFTCLTSFISYIFSLLLIVSFSPILAFFYSVNSVSGLIILTFLRYRLNRKIYRTYGRVLDFHNKHKDSVLYNIVKLFIMCTGIYLLTRGLNNYVVNSSKRIKERQQRRQFTSSSKDTEHDEKEEGELEDIVERKLWNAPKEQVESTSRGKTCTPEQFLSRYFIHRITIYFGEDKNKFMRGYAAFAGANYIIIPKHFLIKEDLKVNSIEIKYKSKRADYDILVTGSENIDVLDIGVDLCLVKLIGIVPQKKISKFLSNERINYAADCEFGLLTMDDDDNMEVISCYYIEHRKSSVEGLFKNKYLPYFECEKDIKRGDCGSLLIEMKSKTIVGMLHSRNNIDYKGIICEEINKGLIDALIQGPIMTDEQQVISYEYCSPPLADYIHAKSPLNFFKEPYREGTDVITRPASFSYGQLGEKPCKIKFSPKVNKTLLYEPFYSIVNELEFPFIVEDYGAPIFDSLFPRWKPMSDAVYNMSYPMPYFTSQNVEKIVKYKQRQFSRYGEGIKPLSMLEFSHGKRVKGFNEIKGIEFSTSMGFPINKSKKPFSILKDGKREFDISVTNYLEDYKKKILSGNGNVPVFTAAHKNEVVEISKNKVRIFFGCDIHFAYLARCYLLPIFNCITHDPLLGTSYVGCNYNGKDWEQLYSYFKDLDVIDGDYKKFDQRVPIWVKRAIFAMLDPILENSSYTDEDKVLYRFAMECMFTPVVNVNGELIAFENLMPSGVPITVLFNCLVSYFYVELGYLETHPEAQPGDLRIITYGDDNLVGKDPNHEVDINAIQAFLRKIGISYTPSDKSPKFSGWKSIKECTFLKRGFLPLDDGRVLAPLELSSILKPIFFTVSKELLAQSTSVMINVIREAAHQSEEISRKLIKLVEDKPYITVGKAKIRLHSYINHVYPKGWSTRNKILANIYEKKNVQHEPLVGTFKGEEHIENPFALVNTDEMPICNYELLKQKMDSQRSELSTDYKSIPPCIDNSAAITRGTSSEETDAGSNGASTLGLVQAHVNRPTNTNNDIEYKFTSISMMGTADIYDVDNSNNHNLARHEVLNQNNTPDLEFSEVLKRPLPIVNWTWTSAAEFRYNYNVAAAFRNDAFFKRKFDNYAFISGKVRIKFLVNGSPFLFGKLIIATYYNDYGPVYKYRDRFTEFASNTDTDLMIKMRASMTPHVVIDPSTSESPEIVMPFLTPYSKISLHNFIDDLDIWISAFQISPLSSASDETTVSTNITVIANLEDIVLSGPTMDLISVSSSEEDELAKEKQTSKPSDYISKAADIVDTVGISNPSIMEYTTPTSLALRLGARLAKLLGYAKPIQTESVREIYPNFSSGITNVDTSENLQKLTLSKSQCIDISDTYENFSEFNLMGDPLVINNFCARECYYATTQWSSSQGIGSLVMAFGVTPSIFNWDTNVNEDEVQYSHLGLVSQLFKLWRGKITYRFEVVCSKFHKGRLRICWDPRLGLASGTSLTGCKNVILDLGERREAEITIDWGVERNYLACDHYHSGVAPQFLTHVGNTLPTPDYNLYNGIVTVNVMNQLCLPNGTVAPVDLNLYVKSDDIEFAIPTTAPLQKASLFSSVGDFQSITPEACQIEDKLLGPRSDVTIATIGERCYSLRSLLKRYELNEIYLPQDLDNYDLEISRPFYPPVRGKDPNPIITDYNYTNFSAFSMIASCFLGVRGGMRVKVFPTSVNTSVAWNRPNHSLRTITYNPNVEQITPTYTGSTYQLAYDTTDLKTAQKVYLKMYNTMEASAVSHSSVNSSLEVELPFYSEYKFLPGRNLQNTVADNYWTYRGPNDRLQFYYATAEDTQFFGLMSVPKLYIYSLPTSG